MNDQTDSQLLRAYAGHRSDPAFAELVRRHVDHVHSAALRMVNDSHLAQDVTQGVFVALAKNAGQLADRAVLSGWLHRTAQNIAAQTVRTDVRRRAREQEAAAMNELLTHDPGADWKDIAPHLDAALGELPEPERDALMLRYFERKTAREMAQTLGISDEAAQKRVSRAVEHLRELFAKRGVTAGATGLVVMLSANAVQAAPVGLAVTISAAATLTAATLTTTATATAVKTIAMTTLQKTLVTATVAVLAGAGIYEARQAAHLREQVQTLQQQQGPLAEQLKKFENERAEMAGQLASLNEDNERLKQGSAELLRLRGEVTRLRSDSKELAQLKSGSGNVVSETEEAAWLERVKLLKKRLEQIPNARTPEFEYLTQEDWLQAAKRKLETESDFAAAFQDLRRSAGHNFLSRAEAALRKHMDTHDGKFPTELSQLNEHFETPVSDEILQLYQIVPAEKVSHLDLFGNTKDWFITRKDTTSDTDWALGTRGVISTGGSNTPEMNTLAPAIKAMMDNTPRINGRISIKLMELGPYLTTPEQKAAFETLKKRSGK